MWTANHDARRAGVGHHRASRRRARVATEQVAEAEALIGAINAGAADAKQRLATVEAQARHLDAVANPSPGGYGVDDLLRGELHQVERLLRAVDVWTAWTHGRSVAVADLTDSAEILVDAANGAPLLASQGTVDHSHWLQVVEPLLDVLRHAGVDLAPDALDLERHGGPELGIEL
jgi:hypothetical protein